MEESEVRARNAQKRRFKVEISRMNRSRVEPLPDKRRWRYDESQEEESIDFTPPSSQDLLSPSSSSFLIEEEEDYMEDHQLEQQNLHVSLYRDLWDFILKIVLFEEKDESNEDKLRRKRDWMSTRLVNREWFNIVNHLFKFDDSYFVRAVGTGNDKAAHFFLKKFEEDPILAKKDRRIIMNTAFSTSCARGYLSVVELLLKRPDVNPSNNMNDPIREASYHGWGEVVQLLLSDPRVDPSECRNEAIRYASFTGSFEVVQLLMADKRVDPSAEHNHSIRVASYYGFERVVDLLLKDPRVDPTVNQNEPIRVASSRGMDEVVGRLLLDKRVDPSAGNDEAIKAAAQQGHSRTLLHLLKDDRVKIQDALRLALSNRHEECAKLLLQDKRLNDLDRKEIHEEISKKNAENDVVWKKKMVARYLYDQHNSKNISKYTFGQYETVYQQQVNKKDE
eukprot:TRINITY_DN4755_c0_g1_i1.p1 TRINITY_DN4755_c0_g1~~TRINITY_DN4755_c0_g1_i1.p1  ORF type:complete len:449 (+),score=163.72 TRINITY_DN4755_c0_g1_i1:209-1555(+)